jgi:DNA polymerase-3 subunit delta'
MLGWVLDNFYGNPGVVETLEQMIRGNRITQTLLFSGPEGVGKATLARRFAATLLGDAHKIEQDDLSLESIQQMRFLKERAPLKPLKGSWRVFLIDSIDRANEQAANSLLKTLEEPPPHLILIMTARNPYDLLPTIRSRSVPFRLVRLDSEAMRHFNATRGLDHAERREKLADGAPGLAVSIDLETYDRRRTAMLALLKAASGTDTFGAWMKHSESIAARRTEKLDSYLEVLYLLLSDVLRLFEGVPAGRNADIGTELQAIAHKVSFDWLRRAIQKVDQLVELVRRNIQKSIALDAWAVDMLSTR